MAKASKFPEKVYVLEGDDMVFRAEDLVQFEDADVLAEYTLTAVGTVKRPEPQFIPQVKQVKQGKK